MDMHLFRDSIFSTHRVGAKYVFSFQVDYKDVAFVIVWILCLSTTLNNGNGRFSTLSTQIKNCDSFSSQIKKFGQRHLRAITIKIAAKVNLKSL